MNFIHKFNLKTSIASLFLYAPILCAAQVSLPDIPEPYIQSVTSSMIVTALLRADYESAKIMTGTLVGDYLRSGKVNALVVNAIYAAVDKLNAILNDSTTTPAQKEDALNKLIDQSILTYESAQAGALKASYRYSLEFQMARLFIDVERRKDYCGWKTYVDNSGGSFYEQLYALRTPDIAIYRQYGTERKLVATFIGRAVPYSDKYSLAPTLSALKADWETYRSKATDMVTRTPIDIPSGLYLQNGKALLYEIVASYAPVPTLSGTFSCGSNAASKQVTVTSTVAIDANGDARVDVIPSEVYAALSGRAIVPIVSTLLLEK